MNLTSLKQDTLKETIKLSMKLYQRSSGNKSMNLIFLTNGVFIYPCDIFKNNFQTHFNRAGEGEVPIFACISICQFFSQFFCVSPPSPMKKDRDSVFSATLKNCSITWISTNLLYCFVNFFICINLTTRCVIKTKKCSAS